MKFIGVDGCKAGWISACFGSKEIIVFRNFEELISNQPDDFSIFIDIPIGLASENNKIRSCEIEARKFLSQKKKSSIFPVPCRESLIGRNYEEAKAINQEILGRGISKQTWIILPKIKEVNHFLIDHSSYQASVKESHPEISFQFLNKGIPLKHSKKTKKGISERLKILKGHNQKSEEIFNKGLANYLRKEVAKDDILDAMCLAVTAELFEEFGHSIPPKPLFDEFGIKMAIHYATGF